MKVVDVNTADQANTTIILEDMATGDQTKVTYRDRLIDAAKAEIVYKALRDRSSAMFTLTVRQIEGDTVSTEILDVADRGIGTAA